MPVNSGIFMAVLTMCGTVFIKDYNVLSDIGSYVIWFFYTMAFAGIFILRKEMEKCRTALTAARRIRLFL